MSVLEAYLLFVLQVFGMGGVAIAFGTRDDPRGADEIAVLALLWPLPLAAFLWRGVRKLCSGREVRR